MLMQVHYLDECFVILLLYRHEHADNITKQVGSALWHTVEEYGLIQPDLVELSIQLVQVITLCDYFWHCDSFPGNTQKRIPAVAGILKNLAVLMGC
jgi:hypothetical protein